MTIGQVSYAAIAGGTLLAMLQCDAPLAAYIIVAGVFGGFYAFLRALTEPL